MNKNLKTKFILIRKIFFSIGGASIIIFAYLNFFGIPDSNSILNDDVDNFKPQMEVTYSNVTFYNPTRYDTNYKSNLVLNIETYTPHLSKINVKLIDYNFSSEINNYLDYEVKSKLPQSSTNYSISMSDYSYSIDKKHTLNESIIPIEIENLWIDPYHMSYDTSFKFGTIKIQVEFIDIQDNNNNLKEDYIIPVYWINKASY